MKRRLLSMLLVCCLLVALLPTTVFAADIVASGACGDNLTWVLDSSGTLIISGTGKMANYAHASEPWYAYRSSIQTVNIKSGATSIGDYAFDICTNLTDVAIPDSVTSIGAYTFRWCTSLTEITIPDKVTAIDNTAFDACSKLISIKVDAGNAAYSSLNGVLFDKEQKKLINCPRGLAGTYTIPTGITNIDYYAFDLCTSLTNIIIPDTVTMIGNRAFSRCYSLVSASIPDSVTCIGEYTFFGCNKLKSVSISNKITIIGDAMFDACEALSSITIPNSVISIGVSAFNGCYALTSVTIPENVTSIENNAFYACSGLTIVTIPTKMTIIGDGAFYSCNKLTDVYFDGTSDQFNSISIGSGNDDFTNATIHYNSSEPDTPLETEVNIPSNAVKFNGHSYYLFSNTSGGAAAEAYCESLGGHLATITSAEENAFLYSYIKSLGYNNAFFGFTDSEKEGTWKWVTGEPVSYTNWHSGEPNAETSSEDWAMFYWKYTDGKWNDGGPSTVSGGNQYICEWDTSGLDEPTPVKGDISFSFSNSGTIEAGVRHSITAIIPDAANLREDDITWSSSNPAVASITNTYFLNGNPGRAMTTIEGVTGGVSTIKVSTSDGRSANYTVIVSGKEDIPVTYETSSNSTKKGTTVRFNGGVYKENNEQTEMDIDWDFSLFNTGASTSQNDLAIAALVLSGNANDANPDAVKETLNALEFGNIVPRNYSGNADWNEYDDINRVGYVLSSAKKNIGGQQTNIIAVVCRGSSGKFLLSADWQSNLFQQALGFRIAAEDVKSGLDHYISRTDLDMSLPTKYFITGHSRGGAVANILGQIVSDAVGNDNVYVYTFACPNTTTESNRFDYTNIHNIVNTDDLVPTVPPMWWYHPKFGQYYEFASQDISGYESCFQYITGLPSDVITDTSKEFEGGYSLPFVKLRNHAPAVYMSFLIAEGVDGIIRNPRKVIKGIAVKCPVDVLVYDGDGSYLGAIVDNVPDDNLLYYGVFTVVEGDEKYLYIMDDLEIRLELVGTDSGEMSYCVQEIDMETQEIVEEKVFNSIMLTDGKTMTSIAASEISASDTQLFLLTDDEVTAEIDTDGSEQEVVLLSFDTVWGENIRDISIPKGSKVDALPTATMGGYTFTGWYTDEARTEAFDPEAIVENSMTLHAAYSTAFEIYGKFASVSYDGEELTATLDYDYNRCDSNLFIGLYQNGRVINIQELKVPSGTTRTTVTMPSIGLYGVYQLKAFILDDTGSFTPISTCNEIVFLAN